ncbi:phage tail length tape measure family protein [Methylopila sp. M107]|uniref:phage tail length tape measure family protein n=1 Tax=Methylopila sp. M107 TaxID=1101190 RepID=UPI00039E05F3|nr:phage tail length tape measure family protein [Methylopila sp. M107]
MTLRLSVLIDANARGATAEFAKTRAEMDQTATTAKKLGAEAKTAATGIDDAAAATDRLKVAQKAARDEAKATLAQIVAVRDALAGYAADAERAAARSAQAVNRRFNVRDDFGTAGREADVAAWVKSRDDMRAKFDPMFAVQRTYVANLREIREAERLGVLSSNMATAAIDRQKAAYAAYVTGARARGGAGGSQPGSRQDNFRRQNLTAQGFDVFTSLAGGMNPLLIAAQQGPQIVQAYGGVKETIEGVKGAFTATRLAVLGVTGVVVGGAMAWNGYLTSTKAVETALAGVGRGSGATRAQLMALADDAASFGLTPGKVREIEAIMLRAGDIGAEAFRPMLATLRDFAATIGMDVDDAAKKYSGILADPGKGADQLRSMKMIDAATASQAQRLAGQNKIYEAQALLIKAVEERIVSANQSMTAWQRGVERLSNSLSQAWSDVGQGIERLVSGPGPDERLGQINAEIARRSSGRFRFNLGEQEQIAKLRKERDEIAKTIEANRQKVEQGRSGAIGDRAVDSARGILGQSPSIDLDRRREQLKSEIRALEERRRTGAAYDAEPEKDAELRRQEAAALEAKKSALAGLIPESQRQAELDRIDLQIMTARDPVSRAALERRRAEVAALGEETSATEKAAQARNAYAKAVGEAVAGGSNKIADLREETAARAAVNDAVASGIVPLGELDEIMRQQAELRPYLIALDKAEGQAKTELAGVIAGLRGAYAAQREERARSAGLQAIGNGRDDLERMKAELALVTAGNVERERALALLEADQRIRAIFGSEAATNPEAQQMRANALAAANLRSELDRTKQAYEDIKTVGGGAIDSVTQQFVSQSGSWKSVITGVQTDIQGQMATWAIANPLKNALFGSNLPTMQDAGGVLGRLMGNTAPAPATATAAIAGSTAMMNVSATNVIVNGGGAGIFAGKVADGAIAPSAAIPPAGVKASPAAQSLLNSATNERVAGAFSGIRTSGTGNVDQLNPEFKRRLLAFQEDVDKQIGPGLSVYSGFRTPEHQARLYAQSGGSGMVAPKGRSMHGPSATDPFGQAADLNWNGQRLDRIDPATRSRIHEIANDNDLRFPMNTPGRRPYEPWHVEPVGGRRQGGLLGPTAEATKPITPAPDATSILAADKSLVSLSTSAQRADTTVTGFGGSLDQTAKTLASSATGVSGSSKQLEAATAAVPGQAQGFFQTLLGGLGRGLDGLASGIGGFFSRLFGGGGATVAHTGAIIGAAGNDNRPVSAGLFANAPRAHSGALLSGERRLIAKVGEGVFTPRQMDNADRLISAAMQPRSLRVMDERPRTAAALAPPLPAAARESAGGGGGGLDRIRIINPPGMPLAGRVEERRRSDGGRDVHIQLAELVRDDMQTPGSPTSQALAAKGVVQRPIKRGM